jgi:hypothetical protein
LTAAHHLFYQTHDHHDYRAPGATAGDLTDDCSKVEPASGCARDGRDKRAK